MPPAEEAAEQSPRLLVHLLDYLAVDYGGAVKNGKILSVSEYKEQQEFVKKAVELSQTLPEIKASPEIQSLVQNLNGLIQSKADPDKVAALSRQTQAKVIALVQLAGGPGNLAQPDLGPADLRDHLFQMPRHGGTGRRPFGGRARHQARELPGHGQDGQMTPFQVFNTVRLGVPGTPMAPFPSYSDQDTWNVAFYVLSLRFQKAGLSAQAPTLAQLQKEMGLSDDQLLTAAAIVPETELEKKIRRDARRKSRPPGPSSTP